MSWVSHVVHQTLLELLVGQLHSVQHEVQDILQAQLILRLDLSLNGGILLILNGASRGKCLSPLLDEFSLHVEEENLVPHHSHPVEVEEVLEL